jgi:hypothetical protein
LGFRKITVTFQQNFATMEHLFTNLNKLFLGTFPGAFTTDKEPYKRQEEVAYLPNMRSNFGGL